MRVRDSSQRRTASRAERLAALRWACVCVWVCVHTGNSWQPSPILGAGPAVLSEGGADAPSPSLQPEGPCAGLGIVTGINGKNGSRLGSSRSATHDAGRCPEAGRRAEGVVPEAESRGRCRAPGRAAFTSLRPGFYKTDLLTMIHIT